MVGVLTVPLKGYGYLPGSACTQCNLMSGHPCLLLVVCNVRCLLQIITSLVRIVYFSIHTSKYLSPSFLPTCVPTPSVVLVMAKVYPTSVIATGVQFCHGYIRNHWQDDVDAPRLKINDLGTGEDRCDEWCSPFARPSLLFSGFSFI